MLATNRRYILQDQLGAGAMGAVFRATDRLTAETIAFKRVKPPGTNTPAFSGLSSVSARLMLAHEFQLLASLRHPNVIGVLDYGFENDQPFFTMPLLQNAHPITQVARQKTLNEQVQLLIQLLQALVYLHRRGVIHRDLKPDNVLVTAEGQVKVLDFGVATQQSDARREQIVGTLAYMPPEVLQGSTPNRASDLYAVGVIAYEMFTGQRPFRLENVTELLRDILTAWPDMSSIRALTFSSMNPSWREALLATEVHEALSTGLVKPLAAPPPPPDADMFVTLQVDEDEPVSPLTRFLGDVGDTVVMDEARLNRDDMPASLYFEDFTDEVHPLALVVRRLLAKHPSQRYQDAAEVIRDLGAIIGESALHESSAIRESFLQAAHFVGREAEFESLQRGLESAQGGQSSLWLIGGESGVGKSRLLDEVRTAALVRGILTVRGQAIAEGGLPYQVWREPLRRLILSADVPEGEAAVLKQLIPDIGRLLASDIPDAPALEGSAGQQRLHATVFALLRRVLHNEALLIVLEDLQWADSESLDLLREALPLLTDSRLLLLGNYRDDEAPDLPASFPDAQVLKLERLKRDDITQLSTAMLGHVGDNPELVELLQRETEGNVFFLVEVVRALAEEAGQLDKITSVTLPASIFSGGMQKIIQRRVEQVPAVYLPLLEIAAVAGRGLNLRLLKAVAEYVNLEDWLTACSQAAVIESLEGQWRFTHDKLREHLLANLPAERSVELHRQVAEMLERLHPDTADSLAATLAYHWRYAGDREKELHYTYSAGQQAYNISAYHEAKSFFERALMLIPVGSTSHAPQRIDLNIQLGGLHEHLSDYPMATQYLNAALEQARQANLADKIGRALFGLGWLNVRQGETDAALEKATETRERARQAGDTSLLADGLNLLGIGYLIKGEAEQAQTYLLEALPLARANGDKSRTASTLNALGAAYEMQENYSDAGRYLEEALALAEGIGYRLLVANISGNLGRMNYSRGQHEAARRYLEQSRTAFHAIGNPYGEAIAAYYLAFVDMARGQTEAVHETLHHALHLSRTIGAPAILLLTLTAYAMWFSHDGQPERAAELVGLIRAQPHSQSDRDIERKTGEVLEKLRAALTAEASGAAQARGAAMSLDEQVNALLEG